MLLYVCMCKIFRTIIRVVEYWIWIYNGNSIISVEIKVKESYLFKDTGNIKYKKQNDKKP